MNILHVVPSMGESKGGPSRSVGQLCGHLASRGQVHLLTRDDPSETAVSLDPAVRAHFVSDERCRRKLLKIAGFTSALESLFFEKPPEVLHQHGIWLRCSHETSRFATRTNVPLIISPRGMLEPWALGNSKWKKKLAWALYQKQDLQRAAAFHATAPSEAESIRRLGFKQPIAVIPNGVQLPEVDELEGGSIGMRKGGIKTAFFLSRINPKKGLLMLLDAWKRAAPKGWRLLIAGNDDSNHLPTVERRINDLDLADVVEYIGPLFGKNKEQAYRDADIFVLPSYSENFGIVVPEALSYQVPVLTTTGCPWEELETHACGWWVEPTIDGIEGGLRDALRRNAAELNSLGARGRKLVEERYQWPSIAEKMSTFYDWILNGGSVPDFVYKD